MIENGLIAGFYTYIQCFVLILFGFFYPYPNIIYLHARHEQRGVTLNTRKSRAYGNATTIYIGLSFFINIE